MNKILLTTFSIGVLSFLTACTTTPKPVEAPKDEMPNNKYVVAKNIDEAIARSETRVQNNLALLRDVEGRRALSPEILTHNNGLDARSASDKQKIVGPQFGAPQGTAYGTMMAGSDPEKVARFQNTVNRLVWQNSSLNQLLQQISAQVGYNFIAVPGAKKDVNFSLEVPGTHSILNVLEYVAKANQSVAKITVSHVKQTITVSYK